MRTIQDLAIFMIFLVITIPVYSAVVYAQFNDDDVYSVNSGGVLNYRAAEDATKIVAEIEETGVAKEKVSIGSKSFTSCTPVSGRSVCEFIFDGGAVRYWPASRHQYSVNYDSPSGIQTARGTIIVDNKAPNVTINSIQSGKELTIKYSVKERALDDSTSNECSGIKSIDVTLGEELINTTVIGFKPGEKCDYLNQYMKVSAPSTNDVPKYLCLDISDNVGNTGRDCKLIIVDAEIGSVSEPQIIAGNGQVMEYISPKIGPISAYVRFKLNERNLSSIKADASEFSFYAQQQQQMTDVPVVCNPGNCNGTCSCDALITLNLPAGGTPVLKLNITDISGNNALALLPVEVKVDSESPRVQSITAKQCGDKNALGPRNNSITVVVSESGSGMDAGKIYLDLSSVKGTPASRVPENYCNPTADGWLCYWGLFSVDTNPRHGSILQVPIGAGSQDDAGNFLVSEPASLFYDSQPPFIESVTLRAVRNVFYDSEIEAYPTSGGTIELVVVAKDDLSLTARADFSKVSAIGKRSVVCEGTVNKTCTFSEIGPLFNGPKSNLVIPINITDCVGNTYSTSIKMNISVLTEKQGDYWSYQVVKRVPDTIDKSTMNAFAHNIFFTIQPSPTASARPISQTVVSCGGETGYLNASNKGKNLPILIGAPSGDNLMAKFTIQRTASPPDNLNFVCTIKTITRTNAGYISPPEYDNVTFEIKAVNDPLGTIDEALQNKVDKVKNSWLVKEGGFLTSLKKTIGYLEKACGLWNTLMNIAKVVDTVAQTICLIKIFPVYPGTCKAANGLGAAQSYLVHDGLGEFMQKFCAYVSCNKVPFVDGVSQFMKDAINTWRGSAFIKSKGVAKDIGTAFGEDVKIEPKDSLIISVATICLPGVVHNLDKARQIECNYIYCVQNQVTAGVPPYMCNAVRATAWCKYVWHEVFQFIPFIHAFDQLSKQIGMIFSDNMYKVSTALAICNKLIPDLAPGCRIIEHIATITSIGTELIFIRGWQNLLKANTGQDMCGLIK